jgi:hypothetical protein
MPLSPPLRPLILVAALGLAGRPAQGQSPSTAPEAGLVRWLARDTLGFHVALDVSLPEGSDVSAWVQGFGTAYDHALSQLGISEVPAPNVYLIASRDRLRAITGVAANGLTDIAGQALYFVYGSSPNPLALRHEAMHWVAARAWSPPFPADWVNEGVAVFGQGRCSGYPVRAVAAALAARGELFSLDSLANGFRQLPELRAYLSAGSFVTYVYLRDPASLRLLWRQGLADVAAAFGTDVAHLEEEWHLWLTAEPVEARAPADRIIESCRS